MNKEKLSGELWTIANLITAFTVAQTITFAYTCTQNPFFKLINTFWIKATIALILVLMTAMECCVVWWCARKNVLLIPDGDGTDRENMRRMFLQAGYGRMIIIAFLLIPALLSLYARQLSGIHFDN
jgi:hypothetical protein